MGGVATGSEVAVVAVVVGGVASVAAWDCGGCVVCAGVGIVDCAAVACVVGVVVVVVGVSVVVVCTGVVV